MKRSTPLFLLIAGTLFFFSCKKDYTTPDACEGCVIIAQDTLQQSGDTATLIGPTITVNRGPVSITLTGSGMGSYPDSEFFISMGTSEPLMSEQSFRFNNAPLNMRWDFGDVAPGTYPIQIRQRNYVAGSVNPGFTISVAAGGLPQMATPEMRANPGMNEMEYHMVLQVTE